MLVAERRSEWKEEQVTYSVIVRDSTRDRGGGGGGRDCDSERGGRERDCLSESEGTGLFWCDMERATLKNDAFKCNECGKPFSTLFNKDKHERFSKKCGGKTGPKHPKLMTVTESGDAVKIVTVTGEEMEIEIGERDAGEELAGK